MVTARTNTCQVFHNKHATELMIRLGFYLYTNAFHLADDRGFKFLKSNRLHTLECNKYPWLAPPLLNMRRVATAANFDRANIDSNAENRNIQENVYDNCYLILKQYTLLKIHLFSKELLTIHLYENLKFIYSIIDKK